MEEKRLYRRTELSQSVKLSIVGNYGEGPSEPVDVEVTDVSSDGLGFVCNEGLRIGELLTGRVILWTKEKVNVIVKIVRAKENEDEARKEFGKYEYGCIFVGMEGNDSLRIKIYQLLERKAKEDERRQRRGKKKEGDAR